MATVFLKEIGHFVSSGIQWHALCMKHGICYPIFNVLLHAYHITINFVLYVSRCPVKTKIQSWHVAFMTDFVKNVFVRRHVSCGRTADRPKVTNQEVMSSCVPTVFRITDKRSRAVHLGVMPGST
jgi:hypothetical protein